MECEWYNPSGKIESVHSEIGFGGGGKLAIHIFGVSVVVILHPLFFYMVLGLLLVIGAKIWRY
jgi:hypothetical protein